MVYPRAYGGTIGPDRMEGGNGGLSPRIRGNLALVDGTRLAVGSIPAHTGEPWCRRDRRIGCRVYPRAYGGTTALMVPAVRRRGLSPRIRGNHLGASAWPSWTRSIPAHTGEPRVRGLPAYSQTVYPRAYGGTESEGSPILRPWGLSPRIRGNRGCLGRSAGSGGSIPAHTGEPSWDSLWPVVFRVYPRAYGGTTDRSLSYPCGSGLSPRIRGNHSRGLAGILAKRSIPAHTGEPFLIRPC